MTGPRSSGAGIPGPTAPSAFIVPATALLAHYFALPALVGYWPDPMSTTVVGRINVAYLFARSFVMAWALMAAHVRRAALRPYGRSAGAAASDAHNTSLLMFLLFVGVTLSITVRAARRTATTTEFYSVGRRITD